jgi:hypothetical protein
MQRAHNSGRKFLFVRAALEVCSPVANSASDDYPDHEINVQQPGGGLKRESSDVCLKAKCGELPAVKIGRHLTG